MNLDIRIPIGLMFGVIGALLAAFGLFWADKAIYEKHSLGININLWWGLILLAFGVVMFLLGRRGTSSVRTADETVEGRLMEKRDEEMEEKGRPKRGGH
jgi:uncharacterized membrane protein